MAKFGSFEDHISVMERDIRISKGITQLLKERETQQDIKPIVRYYPIQIVNGKRYPVADFRYIYRDDAIAACRELLQADRDTGEYQTQYVVGRKEFDPRTF